MKTENDDPPISHNNDFRLLEAIIYVFGINKQIWSFVDDFFQAPECDQVKQLSLTAIIDGFELNKRAWDILEMRYGFHRRLSLDEIAVDLGNLTRERVRQLQYKALEKIKAGTYRVISPLLTIDEQVYRNKASLENITSINEAVFAYQALLLEIGCAPLQGKEIRQLFLLIRALVHAGLLGIDKHLPHLSYAACRLAPAILKHPKLAEQEQERQRQLTEQERKWTYEELAEAVLISADTPLHYTEITFRAEELERRSNVSLKGMHNVLYSNTDKFAYVDQGTYGLTSWGLSSVESYTNIIAEVLATASKALPYGNILQSVSLKREVKHNTLQMTLDMNPRFYFSHEGTYGLRAWLPPREKQTLRTPKWQVETPQSFERVERAAERGYDIEMIITQDKI